MLLPRFSKNMSVFTKERAVYRVHFVLSVNPIRNDLMASANDLSVTVLSENLPQKAVNRPFTKEEALLRLRKMQQTSSSAMPTSV